MLKEIKEKDFEKIPAEDKVEMQSLSMKEALIDTIKSKIPEGIRIENPAISNALGILIENGEEITIERAIMLAMSIEAMNGSVKAAEFIRDTSGNKPVNDVKLEGNLSIEDALKKVLSDDKF